MAFSKSTLPPERIMPTFFRVNFSSLFNSAAKGTAHEVSTIIFMRSQINRMDVIISSSVTVITSLTRSMMMGKVLSPRVVNKPSAIDSVIVLAQFFRFLKSDKHRRNPPAHLQLPEWTAKNISRLMRFHLTVRLHQRAQ